jgi:hypothetical protein
MRSTLSLAAFVSVRQLLMEIRFRRLHHLIADRVRATGHAAVWRTGAGRRV